MPALSVLDLAPVPQGSTPGDALRNARDLAQLAERLGYRRYWLAEHHNMVGIASAATSVAICFVAGGTSTIRVGSGGVMLPNHAPLVIAEQFGTLASLYPGRIDLGLGRAPGTDQRTLRALRRSPSSADEFPQDVLELQALLGPLQPGQVVQAVPGTDTNVPLWETLKVVDRLEKLGTPFEMAFYPGEIHFFRRAFVLRDAWRRSDTFFYQHLVAPAVPLKSAESIVPGQPGTPAVPAAEHAVNH